MSSIGQNSDIALLGNPVLRKKAEMVSDIQDPKVQKLIDTMLSLVMSVNGVGLAAPQLSKSLRIMVIASHPNTRYPHAPRMDPTLMINPVITTRSEKIVSDWEGCLSIPGLRGFIPRHEEITVSYTIRTGEQRTVSYTGFIARIVQHETDHLDGILFIDRVKSNRDLMNDQEYVRMLEREKSG